MAKAKNGSSAPAVELFSWWLTAALIAYCIFGSGFAEPVLADEPLQVVEALRFDSLLDTPHPDTSPLANQAATDAPFRDRVQPFSFADVEISLGRASFRLKRIRLTPPTGPPHPSLAEHIVG